MSPERVGKASRATTEKPAGRPRHSASRQQTKPGQTNVDGPHTGSHPGKTPDEQAKPASAK
jgi:hypothetical protein